MTRIKEKCMTRRFLKRQTANKYQQLSQRALLLAVFLTGSLSAQAILPTPDPEMKDPSSVANSALLDNATTNNASTRPAANNIQTKTVAAIVAVDAQGQTTLQPTTAATRVKPGDTIEYRTYVTNSSADRIRSMTIMMSIPEGVELVGEVAPKGAFASIDGSNFSRMPLNGKINGQVQAIPLQYYKGLRWTLEGLDLNETAVIKYRAVVR